MKRKFEFPDCFEDHGLIVFPEIDMLEQASICWRIWNECGVVPVVREMCGLQTIRDFMIHLFNPDTNALHLIGYAFYFQGDHARAKAVWARKHCPVTRDLLSSLGLIEKP